MIAGEFQHRYMIHGFLGGLLGLMLAGATGFLLFQSVSRLGGGLMMEFSVANWQWALLAMLPVLSAVVTMITARLTVRKALLAMV